MKKYSDKLQVFHLDDIGLKKSLEHAILNREINEISNLEFMNLPTFGRVVDTSYHLLNLVATELKFKKTLFDISVKTQLTEAQAAEIFKELNELNNPSQYLIDLIIRVGNYGYPFEVKKLRIIFEYNLKKR